MPDLKQRNPQAGGCIGCVVPCLVMVVLIIAALGTGTVLCVRLASQVLAP